MYKILIVEDEKDAREGLAELIRQYDSSIEVTVRRDGLEGYQTAIEMQPDVIISDIRMTGCDGLTMASRLQGRRFQGKILLLTGYADFRYAQQAVRYGITEYILKPIVPDEFLPLLQRYLRETEREKLRNERKNPRVSYLFSDADDEALGEQISYRVLFCDPLYQRRFPSANTDERDASQGKGPVYGVPAGQAVPRHLYWISGSCSQSYGHRQTECAFEGL